MTSKVAKVGGQGQQCGDMVILDVPLGFGRKELEHKCNCSVESHPLCPGLGHDYILKGSLSNLMRLRRGQ